MKRRFRWGWYDVLIQYRDWVNGFVARFYFRGVSRRTSSGMDGSEVLELCEVDTPLIALLHWIRACLLRCLVRSVLGSIIHHRYHYLFSPRRTCCDEVMSKQGATRMVVLEQRAYWWAPLQPYAGPRFSATIHTLG